jgi:hypothetical protein
MAWDVAAIIALITAMMPIIDQVIKWIEKLFPKATGVAKKKMAMDVIAAVSPESVGKGTEQSDAISKLIDERVAVLNKTGVLKHKEKKKA